MMNTRMVEISVGIFMLLGVLALVFLVFQVSGLSVKTTGTYKLYAMFSNAGSLKHRAKVAISGVTIGHVTKVELDRGMFLAKVEMSIDERIKTIPTDSTASIVTSGLLGDKYVSISIGGMDETLQPGDRIEDTQSAIVLEDLISKLFVNLVK